MHGLELDIFIEELNVGIEYQGQQHFQPVKHWGGAEALKKTIERDRTKKRLCKKEGVNLVYFTFKEDLSKEYIKNKLMSILK